MRQVYGSEEMALRLRLYAPPKILRLSGGPSSPPAAPAPPAAAPEELLLPLSTAVENRGKKVKKSMCSAAAQRSTFCQLGLRACICGEDAQVRT